MVLRYSTKSSTQHPLLSHKGKEYTCVCLCIHTYNYIYIIESLCFILESNTALYINYESESEGEVAQSCLTLRDPMDCSLPASSVRGIFQARVLEWVAISFSRRSSRPWNRTWVSHIVDTDALPSEPPGKSRGQLSTIFPLKKKKKLFLQREEKAPVLGGQSASEGWDAVPTLKLDLRLEVLFWRLRPKLTSRLWAVLQVLATPEGKCMYIYLYKITSIWTC